MKELKIKIDNKNDLLNLFFQKSKGINIIKKKSYKKSKMIGLSVDLKGRIKNANRSKKLNFTKGSVKKNTYNVYTQCTKQPINTKTGIWMLKIHLLRNISQ